MDNRRPPKPGSINLFRAPVPARPPLASHVAKALGVSPTVQRATAPGGMRLPAPPIPQGRQAVRGAVVQCNGTSTVNEEEGNPGFWYTREVRTLKEYLYVDCHMGDYDPPDEKPMPFKSCNGAALDQFGGSKGSIVRIHYVFGNWNVYVPWPTVWILLGQEYYPAPNRFGFVPSAEFGNPTFSGETSIRTDLSRISPFTYKVLKGGSYTPEVDFIYGEAMGGMTVASMSKEAKLNGEKAAVLKYLKR